MTVVGGMSLARQKLTDVRHFLFCFNPSHFAALRPQNKNICFNLKLNKEKKETGRKHKVFVHLGLLVTPREAGLLLPKHMEARHSSVSYPPL